MSQNQRSPGTDLVDVFVAVDVKQMRAGPLGNEQRNAANRFERAHRRVHAAGNNFLGSLKEPLGFLVQTDLQSR